MKKKILICGGGGFNREPEMYVPINEFLSEFKYDKDRKELWGMI